ncbi:hypothetical protein M2266_000702 [Streptomyces sp. SPB162]|nr:hypothetical protein [Streptomyces sp. SPB162]
MDALLPGGEPVAAGVHPVHRDPVPPVDQVDVQQVHHTVPCLTADLALDALEDVGDGDVHGDPVGSARRAVTPPEGHRVDAITVEEGDAGRVDGLATHRQGLARHVQEPAVAELEPVDAFLGVIGGALQSDVEGAPRGLTARLDLPALPVGACLRYHLRHELRQRDRWNQQMGAASSASAVDRHAADAVHQIRPSTDQRLRFVEHREPRLVGPRVVRSETRGKQYPPVRGQLARDDTGCPDALPLGRGIGRHLERRALDGLGAGGSREHELTVHIPQEERSPTAVGPVLPELDGLQVQTGPLQAYGQGESGGQRHTGGTTHQVAAPDPDDGAAGVLLLTESHRLRVAGFERRDCALGTGDLTRVDDSDPAEGGVLVEHFVLALIADHADRRPVGFGRGVPGPQTPQAQLTTLHGEGPAGRGPPQGQTASRRGPRVVEARDGEQGLGQVAALAEPDPDAGDLPPGFGQPRGDHAGRGALGEECGVGPADARPEELLVRERCRLP